jgi:hypothetical protein
MSDESEAIKETAKAAQEIAKTTAKAIDVGAKFSRFAARYISSPLEQVSGIIEDKLRYTRWERQVRLMRRAEEFTRDIGSTGPSRPVPLKFVVPLLHAATMEDDDDLQDLWARLLVNAADADSPVTMKRAFIDILKNIGPVEAQILQTIYSIPFQKMKYNGVATRDLPSSVTVIPDDIKADPEAPSPEVQLALANLARNDCLTVSQTWKGAELFGRVNPTVLGKAFVEACTLRQPRGK